MRFAESSKDLKSIILEKYILYGSGGHAKVVLDSLEKENKEVTGFFDDHIRSASFLQVPILGNYDASIHPACVVLITIGNNKIRKKISSEILHRFGNCIYPGSIISRSAVILKGSMILQGSVLNHSCAIGEHVIVNTRAVVEHDVIVENFVHLAPGSVICGNSKIGEGTLVGANAVVGPNVSIGKWCQISAGSAVTENIPDFSLVMGVPGKIIKQMNHLDI